MKMDRTYTEADLAGFLDWLGNKGLVKEATARARRISALKVLSALDDHEKLDLRNIDREVAFQRFVNKESKNFNPQSLATYRGRFNTAMDDFLRYKADPTSFKPGTQQRTVRKGQEPGAAAGKKSRGARATPAQSTPTAATSPPIPPSLTPGSIVFPIPLRQGVVVQIHNLPNDLTVAEAQRISAIVTALAIPEEAKANA